MPKIQYQNLNFREQSLSLIKTANRIITEYLNQGFDLTLRQLYYQFVARAIIPNNERSYKNLGNLVNDARLAGLIDWEAISDRTRNLRSLSHWSDPKNIVHSAASSYRNDKWEDQPNRIEVWIEKDALVGVIARVCEELDVPYFSCRGYTSQSEMWAAAQRLVSYQGRPRRKYGTDQTPPDNWCQMPVILHLGDHDPSGLDMSRDIRDRLEMFTGYPVKFRRLALNRDQIEQYDPPPNPAKVTDVRANAYIAKHGDESWELDALEPTVIADLIRDAVFEYRDQERWETAQQAEDRARKHLEAAAEQWPRVVGFLESSGYLA